SAASDGARQRSRQGGAAHNSRRTIQGGHKAGALPEQAFSFYRLSAICGTQRRFVLSLFTFTSTSGGFMNTIFRKTLFATLAAGTCVAAAATDASAAPRVAVPQH